MIHRDGHEEQFVIVSNDLFKDKNLSLSARGLLGFMLTFANDWTFTFENLTEQSGAKKYEVRKTILELQSKGYVKFVQNKTEQGRFASTSYEVFEKPLCEIPQAVKPHTEKRKADKTPKANKIKGSEKSPLCEIPHTVNRTLNNNNIVKSNNTKVPNRDIPNFDSVFEQFPIVIAEPELKSVFQDFIEARKKMKSPLTEQALKLNIKKAIELGNGEPDRIRKVVEQTLMHGWKSMYPLKAEPQPIKQKQDWFADYVNKYKEGDAQ